MRPDRHPEEAARLAALSAYEVLDTPHEAEFDDLVALASRICETPVALVTLLDGGRQWFKAAVGVDVDERPYDESFCAHAILERGLIEVPDLRADRRFADNAIVVGEPGLRFYASVPLESPEGLPIGTLCVIDTVPRQLTDLQRDTLRVLGRQAMTQLELRRRLREGEAGQERTDRTLEMAGVATWAWDAGADRVASNRLLRAFFGLGAQGEGLRLLDFLLSIHPEDREGVSAAIGEAVHGGAPYETEYRVIDAEGAQRWVLARGTMIPGTATLAGILVDVTARKAAEAALEAERRQFRRLLDEVPGHVVTMRGPELRYDFANRAFLAFLGRPADFLGQRAEEAWPVPPEHLAMLRDVVARGEKVFGAEVPLGDGVFDFVFQPLQEPDGSTSGVFVHSLDVTEKVRVREAQRRIEERFRVAQEMTPDAFTLLESVRDEAGRIVDFRWTYVNPATERLTGEPNGSLVGASFLEKRPYTRESGQFDAFVAVADTGQAFTREYPVVYRDTKTFLRITAVRVGDGVAASFSDVTERRRTEEELREAVETRTEELREAVHEAERFNYSISHDLRTPLRAISATSQVLLDEAGPELSAVHRELLERQSHNARRLGLLIDQLLRLSRLGRIAMTRGPLDMSAIARAVADEIAQVGDSPCAVEIQEGMAAEGDPALVRLVIGNLLENACKFSKGQGAVRVRQDGPVFAVSDEGIGFDMQYAPKLFLPFERLVRDSEFPGTGIGLANVERIVRRHGGRVWAESEPAKGATFFFTLG